MYRKAWIGFIAAFAVILVGFWPSFYSRGNRPLQAVHILHGGVATLWMVLAIVQSWLISQRHNRLHRWLGWSSVVIVPVFVISGLLVEHAMLHEPRGLPEATEARLTWLDLWSLALFVGLFAAAMVRRRRVIDHARCFTAMVIILLPPALGRLLANILGSLDDTLLPITLLLSAVLVALMALDRVIYRLRPHPAYLATLGLLVLVQLTYPVTQTPGFAAFGRWLGGV